MEEFTPTQNAKSTKQAVYLGGTRGEGRSVPVAQLTIEIEIAHAQSLKDRRQVVRSLKDKLRHGFNLAVAELDEGLVWNRATLGIATISSSTAYLTGQNHEIDRAVHRIANTLGAEILDSFLEILSETSEIDAPGP